MVSWKREIKDQGSRIKDQLKIHQIKYQKRNFQPVQFQNTKPFLATATTDLKPLRECICRKQQVENLKNMHWRSEFSFWPYVIFLKKVPDD